MAFKYGVDWDWENSLRKNEIVQAIKPLPSPPPMEEYVSNINQFKPKSVKPFWLRCHSLDYGDTEKTSESFSVGVKMTETMSNSTEESISAGFKSDLFSVDASLKETHSLTISNECPSTSTESFKKIHAHDHQERANFRKVYYQLYVSITYEDGEKRYLGTSNFESVYMEKNVNRPDDKPVQSAENAWKSMQS